MPSAPEMEPLLRRAVDHDYLHLRWESRKVETVQLFLVDHELSGRHPPRDLDAELRAVAEQLSVLGAHWLQAVHQHSAVEGLDCRVG
jgi:hypothetical protein